MAQIKIKLEDWSVNMRPRVGTTVMYNNSNYVNVTGINSLPNIGSDWLKNSGKGFADTTEFTPSANAASETFTLTNTRKVIQVINEGSSIPKAQWSQVGNQITVTPLDGGVFKNGFVQITQQ